MTNDSGAAAIALRPLVRSPSADDDYYSLFVRLTPRTAGRLCAAAVAAAPTAAARDKKNSSGRRTWSIADALLPSPLCASGIEFLPLAIVVETTAVATATTRDDGVVGTTAYYASYNGGDLDATGRDGILLDNGK